MADKETSLDKIKRLIAEQKNITVDDVKEISKRIKSSAAKKF